VSIETPDVAGSRTAIAVAGLACRLPGVANAEEFWTSLVDGRDAVASSPSREGRRPGGYVSGVGGFDAGFFRFTAAEAAATDPQQRILLQLTWHLFEDAGIDIRSLPGLRIGVYVACCSDDYAAITRARGSEAVSAYSLTGTGRSFLANRISHFFNLSGPSIVVDAGQSSSLAAVHVAWNALRDRQIDAAVVAAVQLNLDPLSDEFIAGLGVRSARDRCRPFSDEADGIVRGEGAAALLMVPGGGPLAVPPDPYCFVEAVAMNTDGGSQELTTPSVEGQVSTLREAYALAGVSPALVDYIEAHGTGTRVGDPVEAAAIGKVCGAARDAGQPLLIGSVKSNIGHLEAAAGLAGTIKTILCLRHGLIPATLGAGASRSIAWSDLNLRLVRENLPWPKRGKARWAGVSSFGLGGTNCHLVLRAPGTTAGAPSGDGDIPAAEERGPMPFVISGNSRQAMRRQAAALAVTIRRGQVTDIRTLSRSLGRRRTPLAYRAAVLASEPSELAARLEEVSAGGTAKLADEEARQGKIALLFPGIGVQRHKLGKQLYDAHPAFRNAMEEVACFATPALGRDLRDVMCGNDDWLDRLDLAQPALFAVEIALEALLRDWGVAPDYLIGHSQGEIAVAYLAGMMDLKDATRLAVERGRLMASVLPGGAVAVNAPAEMVEGILAQLGGVVGLAAVNSPVSVVISGTEEAIGRAQEAFAARGIRTRRLRISRATHSTLMRPIREQLAEFADSLAWNAPNGPAVISTMTGRFAAPGDLVTGAYWAEHLVRPVRFADAVEVAREAGTSLFVELGPGHGLSTMVLECVPGTECTACPTLTEADERASVLSAVGAGYVHGVALNWERITGTSATAALPGYAFDEQPYWLGPAPDGRPAPGSLPAVVPVAESLMAGSGRDPEGKPNVSAADMRSIVLAAVTKLVVSDGEARERPVLMTSFTDLGIDSRGAVTIRNRLMEETGIVLPSTVLFDYATPHELIRYLRDECGRRP